MMWALLFTWTAHAQDILVGCEIRNSALEVIRVLPSQGARYCWPFEDGGWVSAGDAGLTRWSPDGAKLWHVPGVFHHQVRVDENGHVLALGREWIEYRAGKHRFDTLLKIDSQGKEVAKFRMRQNLVAIHQGRLKYGERFSFPLWYTTEKDPVQKAPFFQFSHLNSVQVLPPGVRKNAGHYLIHDPVHGVCIGLTENLKLSGFFYEIPREDPKIPTLAHDCQMLEDGSMLYYLNTQPGRDSFRAFHRKGDSVLFTFPRAKSDEAVTPHCGGISQTAEGYLISVVRESSSEIGIVGPDGKWLRKKSIPFPIQDAKVLSQKDFLKKNRIR